MLIGEIKEIIRHPVKSFRGESVRKTTIQPYGLYGDRSHAFLDGTRPGQFLTATQLPAMIGYQAEFIGQESLEKFPQVKITSPSGKTYFWGDEALTKELEEKSGRSISTIQYSPDHIPLGAIEEENVLLATDASLAKLEELWGDKVDHRRFRPNILIAMYENIPFAEDHWFGKRMMMGEAELEIKRHCERCMMITINPDTCAFDPSLLKTVVRERNNYFGVYASVIKTGEIKVGDKIYLWQSY
ncbi:MULTISPECIES: MOSC domain-containing protein [Aneurinibacillus]|uniref:MOSC domain-containing protein n=1 Tax=Aneurinibacillus thermoaerophilus TaxID=143495 RepID=A0A1G8BJH6_ANETH|nr:MULTISPECIES: MOSC domain-containing protein [Aneurinibacillus]AMA73366.1 sulfurase [Aneurinibacillus sp. XH2]MED0676026.1 MOSC domain-containing protein [Aneurinibacillus thermoaerophilus]MED0736309.1 MOSC domain-containing protein [Aneurinibacillus thermoaerophilus]MED0758036.1 MOSC domain-containing protein [Aneurinibacillus thermoaerophilus]MED0759493.1 MOSC domain-containing protein [Aneurinibacillus thermoaerophilus]